MTQDQKLTTKQEALVGLSASIASGCRPCTRIWLRTARSQGACERSIRLAIEAGLAVREAATREMADYAEAQQGSVPTVEEDFRADRTSFVEVLSCAAAVAVQNAVGLERHIDSARGYGASTDQISAAVALGRAIRNEAGKQVEKSATHAELNPTPSLSGSWCCQSLEAENSTPAKGCGCGGAQS